MNHIFSLLISWMIMLVFIVVLTTNVGLNSRVRNAGIKACIFMLIASFAELVSFGINGNESSILLHKVVKAIELSLTPIIPMIASCMFYKWNDDKKFKNIVFFFIAINVFAEIISCSTNNLIFCIDERNNFSAGSFYFFYLAVNILSTTFFFVKAYKFSHLYQTESNILLLSIAVFLVAGTSIQLIHPDILVSWLVQSISLLLLYIFYNATTMYVDKLTTLLNQPAYQNTLEKIDSDELFIITFDVDDFKTVNDTYGHGLGDKVLRKIGKTLKKCYSPYGKVYRVGGDEFAVIIKRELSHDELKKLNSDFTQLLEETRVSFPELPYVSHGAAFYTRSSSIEAVKEEADKNMYREKELNKKQRNS